MVSPAKGFISVEAVPRKKGDKMKAGQQLLPPSDFIVVEAGVGTTFKKGGEIVLRGESRLIPNKDYPFYLLDANDVAGYNAPKTKK